MPVNTKSITINIDPQLLNDCLVIGRSSLNYLLLMRDANYPWFILVPDRDHITEIFQLDQNDQRQLIEESSLLARALHNQFQPDKINIAALGNVVAQLHVHHIARYTTDAVWPAPVWGRHPAKPYSNAAADRVIRKLQQGLSRGFDFNMEQADP